jgi:DNA modification methylase
MTTRIITGNCRTVLAALPAESVHCVVTSPPYWGLRDYSTEPQVWGGDADCEHDFPNAQPDQQKRGEKRPELTGGGCAVWSTRDCTTKAGGGAFCRRCNAWRGSLGLEPTPALYIDHMVAVFREVRRVLRKDGTLWLNIGDSYHNFRTHMQGGQPPQGFHKDKKGQPKRHGQPEIRGSNRASRFEGIKEKDLIGIPWMLAFALRADGWWLRSEITWAKRAPMPESITDRPTGATEKVFLLTKSARYFYDQEAVLEPHSREWFNESVGAEYMTAKDGRIDGGKLKGNGNPSGRNMRNWWLLGPEPFAEAHFATFPTEIPRRAILAGTSQKGVCPKCGAPWERIVEKKFTPQTDVSADRGVRGALDQKPMDERNTWEGFPRGTTDAQTIGWRPTCDCDACDEYPRESWGPFQPMPATVLDPFGGAGTVGLVADRLRRHAILIELNPDYAEMARRRIEDDAGMFADVAAE